MSTPKRSTRAASAPPVGIGGIGGVWPREIYDRTHGFIGLLDVDGTLLDANRTALDFVGARLEEVVGKPFHETPWWRDPASARSLVAAVRRAASGESARFEAVHTGVDGATVAIDFTLTPMCDGTGRVVALLPEGREMEQLAALRAHYLELVELSADWYWEQDERLRFTRVSRSARLPAGPAFPSPLGRTRWALPIAATDDADWAAHRAVHERREPFRHFEYARVADGGDTVWLSVSGAPVFEPGTGRFVGYRGTTREITERRRTEASLAESRRQLAEANARLEAVNAELERRMAERGAELDAETRKHAATQAALARTRRLESIGQLAGGVAHDFNNLLAIIGGNLELIEPYLPATAEADVRELLADARDAVDSGAGLTRRLLAFARQRELEPERLPLNERIRDIARLLERALGERIALHLRLDECIRDAFFDPAGIDAALINLAINARDAMPAGGTLTVETRGCIPDTETLATGRDLPPERHVAIVVTDTGCGMAPEVLERAMDPFFTTEERGRGSGLGLSGVHGFATQSGGSLSISSRVGEGTVVVLCLPRTGPVRSAAPGARGAGAPTTR